MRDPKTHLLRPQSRKTYCGLWARFKSMVFVDTEVTCANCKRMIRLSRLARALARFNR